MGIFLEGMKENGSQTWLQQRQAKDGRDGDGNGDKRRPSMVATGTQTADGDGCDGDGGQKGDHRWARRGRRGKGAASGRETEISLDGDTLGQIARLVDIQTLGDSYMIREELERDD